MPRTATTCPLDCPDACGVVVESDDAGGLVSLLGNPAHGWSRGTMCSKTSVYGELFASPERLLTPYVRAAGELVPASWDQAVARVAESVRGLPGESILAASYAGSMGLVARRFPRRMMHALGAVLTDDGLCDATASAGFELVLGDPVGLDLEQLDDVDGVVLWGCDMARTVQHLQPAVQRLCRSGVPAVVIDVHRSDTVRAVERWGGRGLCLRGGTDAALALGLARLAYERGDVDRAAVARECVGSEVFEEHVRGGHDLEWTARTTGLSVAEIEHLYGILTRSRRLLLKTGVGFTRRRHGGMSMRAVCSLAAVLGRADRVHYESYGTFKLNEEVLDRPDLRPNAPALIHHVQLGRELESGRFRAVFVWGHNPAVTCPDAGRVQRALLRDDLFVVVHEQFMTETAARADVVLPATMFAEHEDVYRSYGHRRLQHARRALRAPEGPRSNVDCFAALARALDLPRETWDVSAEGLCAELLQASAARLSADERARLAAGEPTKLAPAPGRGTPSGRIELASEAARALGQPALATYVPDGGEGGAFTLISAPSKFTHNSTFSHSPRHLARRGAPSAVLHPEDARELGLEPGELVTLSNANGALSLPTETSSDVPRSMVRVDGLPRAADSPEGVGVNVLVSPDVADLGHGNVLYSTRVDLARRANQPGRSASAVAGA